MVYGAIFAVNSGKPHPMKKVIFTVLFAMLFISCEKNSYDPFEMRSGRSGNVNTEFNEKILDGYFITSIAFDSKGNAWLGTFKQGIIKYSNGKAEVFDSTNSAVPASTVIWDIKTDSYGNVWAGCNGLLKYDGKKFTLYNSKNTPMPEDFVYSIAVDKSDNIWFTSCRFREGGIVKYNGSEWKVFTPENSPMPVNSVKSIAIDGDGNAWLAFSEMVSDCYLAKTNGTRWTLFDSEDLGFSPYYFGNIMFNSRNQLCASIDYSLSSTWPNAGPNAFIFDGSHAKQLKIGNNAYVKSLTVDNDDNVWCALMGGFAVWNGTSWMINDTGFSNGVFAIAQSPDGSMWIATGDGIYIN